MGNQLKIVSDSNDLLKLNIKAVRVSSKKIKFYIDGKSIHTWIEPLLKTDCDIWYAFEVAGKPYDVNFYAENDNTERVNFYGMYTYADDPNSEDAEWHTEHSYWHSVAVTKKIKTKETKMNLQKQITKLTAKAEVAYNRNGTQGVIDLIEWQRKVKYTYHYCRSCECDAPVLETTTNCLICGSTVNVRPMAQIQTEYALDIASRLQSKDLAGVKTYAILLAKEVLSYQSENNLPLILEEDRLEDICTSFSSQVTKGAPVALLHIVKAAYAADDMYKEKKAVLKQLKDNAVTASPRAAFIYNCLYNHLDELDTSDLSQAFLNGSK